MYPITNFDVGIDVNHELMHRDGLSRVLIARYRSLRNSLRGENAFHGELPARKFPRAETRYKEAFSLPWLGGGRGGRKKKDVFSSTDRFFASNRIFTRVSLLTRDRRSNIFQRHIFLFLFFSSLAD